MINLRHTMIGASLVIFLSIISNSALAQQSAATSDNIHNLSKQGFSEVGSAQFSVLFWDIYQSTLYTPTGKFNQSVSANPNEDTQAILFEIKYLRDISKQDLIERTVEQWQHLGMVDNDYSSYLPLLEKIWPDIKKGDRLALLLQQDSSRFYFNDQFAGEIADQVFGEQFLAIWLAENTSQPKLRRQLLGAKN